MGAGLWVERKLQLCIVAADIHAVLYRLASVDILLSDVTYCNPITVKLWIRAQDMEKLRLVVEKAGAQYRIVGRKGFLWRMQVLLRRPLFAIGLLCFLSAGIWLSGRIFFVEVEGNQTIPDKYILENARYCGIAFGSKRKDVRSEKTKNELLSKIPQLQWVGVNTSGCVARIVVKEGSVNQKTQQTHNSVSMIVAARDGVIGSISALRGTPMCAVGQSVKQGDILISGYTDCGLKTVAELAQGEIYGYTQRELTVLALKPLANKDNVVGRGFALRLRIGKKLINLWNDSGISDATCDKMYVEEYWTLPGGFQLPISLIKESTVYYAQADSSAPKQDDWLVEHAESYLNNDMVAGHILSKDISLSENETCSVLRGEYACYEMIGKVKYEETLQENAKDN